MWIKQIIKNCLNFRRHISCLVKGSKIPFHTFIRHNVTIRKSKIGDYCYIGENSGLNCVDMGNYCSIATDVRIGDMEHSVDYLSTSLRLGDKGDAEKRTVIGNDVWIGTQACIRQGVTIGTGAVVGAQSFVNKDVPPYAIVVGTPARILRFRFAKSLQDKLLKSEYWNLSPNEAKKKLSEINKTCNL